MKRIKYVPFLITIAFCFISCTVSTPFKTSDSDKDPNRIVLVALTHVVLNPNSENKDLFWDYVFKIEENLSEIPGAVGHSLRKKLFTDEGWTMSVWENEASMNNFVQSGLHKEAVEKSSSALKLVEYARVKLPRGQINVIKLRRKFCINGINLL
jgi:heme-degrading monooxygenase HmoA